ncbi:GH92 family glycosyl hydrolase [Muricauda sp. SCSIO 64092]|uniref:GH92 family glycosyl hydrolase n=1 Tax=Allomuricauda sp. SCSIO 64092 TaxID=2908842 RepID=UPI001FF6C8D2|nr:GH92 family glycosyl hydrolase [Muricauda sp. SCSIO 64092]UOY05884.1 GH92 family glycosyl hydrolase [Muricauda sp. SCSIO 64092]
MTKVYSFFFIILFLNLSCTEEKQNIDKKRVDYVDPFIGTGGHGHTFPGATAPFGMVQPSPDNGTEGWDWCSGYHISDSIISGFAQLHLSGTGIGDLADVLLMPTHKKMDVTLFGTSRDSLPYISRFSHSNEVASPGYYRVTLDDSKITVALTANSHVAFHQYTYGEGDTPSFIVDLGYAVNWDDPTESYLHLENNHLLTGYRYSTGWAKNQKVFFAIESSMPIASAQFTADQKAVDAGNSAKGVKTGGQFFFDMDALKMVELKVAVSSVGMANAKENLSLHGTPHTFDIVKNATNDQWEEVLSKITVETPQDSLKTIFYTALYHTQLAPVLFNDTNGEFRLQNDSIARTNEWEAYSTLSLWDTFRAQNPLLNIVQPQKVNDIIQSMLTYYDEQGTLPVWTLYANETNTMTGNHGVSVIAEAYLKGLRGYDVDKAYQAVRKTMMGNARGLEPYKEYGFIPYDLLDESVTISLEFAYNDWCVAQMARDLGHEEDYVYFSDRSNAYAHLFDATTGFMRGKSSDGKTWNSPFDPKFSNHRENTDYTEGNAWQHSWFVPHDVLGLIQLHGGNAAFTGKLEQLFTESSEIVGDNISVDISGLIGQYAHGNEPSHHIAYMFNKAGQPWRTQYWVRQILDTQYSTKPDGLSGNEDCGQMSAWYVFSSLGLYPMNPASGEYELGSPIFEKATISLTDSLEFVILAKNTSSINKYIQSVKLNGKPLQRTYITHSELMTGGTLEFEMGPDPDKNWGT